MEINIDSLGLQHSELIFAFLIYAYRFQTEAVANLSIIFFLWSIVSGVLRMFSTDDKFSQELQDFFQGNQNFSIKEFTRDNGFYLNSSTLLSCEFFGKKCHPKVTFLFL